MQNYHSIFNQQIPQQWSQVTVISGPGGNRSDMVIGWLSTFSDQFYPVKWGIDPVTAKNNLSSYWNLLGLKSIYLDGRQPVDHNLRALWQNNFGEFAKRCYNANSLKLLAKSHMSPAWLTNAFGPHTDMTQLITIIPDTAKDIATLRWEFFVKTYMQLGTNIYWDHYHWTTTVKNHYESACNTKLTAEENKCLLSNSVDKTNVQIKMLEGLYQTQVVSPGWSLVINNWYVPDSFDHPCSCVLKYSEVMQEHGYQQIADVLKLTVTSWHQDLWCRILEKSTTSSDVYFLGKAWTKPSTATVLFDSANVVMPNLE